MKVFMLFSGSGPLVLLTSYDSVTNSDLLQKLKAKGIEKFLAFEVPVDLAKERYGTHFFVAQHDLRESDDLRILDYNGQRAFNLFRFDQLSGPIVYERAG